jgi:hypothetical protein
MLFDNKSEVKYHHDAILLQISTVNFNHKRLPFCGRFLFNESNASFKNKKNRNKILPMALSAKQSIPMGRLTTNY